MRPEAKRAEKRQRARLPAKALQIRSTPEPEKTPVACEARRPKVGTAFCGGSHSRRNTGTVETLDARLAALQGLDLAELREEWQRLLGSEPPRLSRDLTLRAVAYGLQERALGGLSPAARRQLEPSPGGSADKARNARPARPALTLGARLVREWRGRTHTIEVIEAGFAFDGKTFRSLSEIARRITGAHWSGPRFFGLTTKGSGAANAAAAAPSRGAAGDETGGGAFEDTGAAEGAEAADV